MLISDWSSDVCSSDLVAVAVEVADIACGEYGVRLRRDVEEIAAFQRIVALPVAGVCGGEVDGDANVRFGEIVAAEADSGAPAPEAAVDRFSVPPRGKAEPPAGRDRPVGERFFRFHRRSEEHTSELQSLMRISYAVFCLNKTNNTHT